MYINYTYSVRTARGEVLCRYASFSLFPSPLLFLKVPGEDASLVAAEGRRGVFGYGVRNGKSMRGDGAALSGRGSVQRGGAVAGFAPGS